MIKQPSFPKLPTKSHKHITKNPSIVIENEQQTFKNRITNNTQITNNNNNNHDNHKHVDNHFPLELQQSITDLVPDQPSLDTFNVSSLSCDSSIDDDIDNTTNFDSDCNDNDQNL